MIEVRVTAPKYMSALVILALTTSGQAQDATKPPEMKTMCPAVIATVMVGKVTCSAAPCNTGVAQGGLIGLAAQLANRRNLIDAASFTVGVGAQLATALKQTGCFAVVDAASIEAARKEMEMLGRPLPPLPAVDFLVRSDINRADLVIDESNLLGFKSRTAKLALGIDTKLVNASTGAVSEATSTEVTTEKKSSGIDIGFYRSGDDAGRRSTPFDGISRDLVYKAAMGLATQIMAQSGDSRPASAPNLPPIASTTAPTQ